MTQWETMKAVLAQAGGGGPGQGSLMDALWSFAPIILIIVVFFWLMSRSQKKKDQKRQDMLSSIKVKDRIMTIGGIHGQVVNVKDDGFVVRIDDQKDVKVTISRSGISRKVNGQEEAE